VRKEQGKQESKPVRREAKAPSGLLTRIRNSRVGRFVLDAYYELRHKVTWPTFEEARNMTIVVIGLSAVIAAILGLADFGLVRLFLLIRGGH
jgi:preprotein translocase SecE subunit